MRGRPTMLCAVVPFLLGIVTVAAQRASGPVLFSDEVAYLGQAVAFSTRTAAVSLPDVEFYSPGYGLLLAPVLSVVPWDPWAVAVGVNLVCAALLGPALRLLLVTATDVSARTATVAATIGACTPSIVLQVPRAWPEVLLAVLVALWAVGVARHLATPGIGVAPVAPAVAAYLVHRRSLVLLAVTAAVLLYAALRRPDRPRAALHLAGGLGLLALGFAAEVWVSNLVRDRLYADADLLDVSDRAAELARGPLLTRLFSQAWGSVHATFGLSLLGAVLLVLRIRRGDGRPWAVAMLLAAGGTLLASVVAVADGPRVDHAFYERYAAPVMAVLVVVAIAAIRDGRPRVRWWAAAALPVSTAVLLLAVDDDVLRGNVQKLTVPALASIEQVVRASDAPFLPGLTPWLLTGVATAVAATVLALGARRPAAGTAVLAGTFVVVVVAGSRLALAPFLDEWERFGADIAAAIAADGGPGPGGVGVSPGLDEPIRAMVGHRLGHPGLVTVRGDDCPDVRHVVLPPGTEPAWPAELLLRSEAPPAAVYRNRC